MSATIVRSPQEFLAELKNLSKTQPAIPAVAQPEPSFAPPSLEQVNAQVGEYRLALEGDSLPDPIRKEVERRLAELVREQFRLVHGFLPDADGNNPAEVNAIVDVATEAATKSVIDALAAAPAESESSEIEPPDDEDEFDLDEQIETLNAIAEIDASGAAAVVSLEPAATISAPVEATPPQQAADGIFLSADVCSALSASVKANLPHVSSRILTIVLGIK
jgi:hypothetical protein